ncbi:MAG: hypothetical protein HZB24_08400 [Desulfobacterales bacterium]|nr:hypothetical protein [Desulfobacterales bacterium]
MVGKITTVLAKKEAEAYCAQGLHAIKSQLQGIRQEMQDTNAQRQRALSPEEIRRIRDGWGDKATETDTLVCAQAFFQLGSYGEALWELKKLLRSCDAKRIHITAAADCLVRLHLPEQLPTAAEALAREMRTDDKSVWAALVVMAKHMEANHYKDHALALYLHLAIVPELSGALRPRIAALSGYMPEPAPGAPVPAAAPPPAPASDRDSAPPALVAKRRFGLGWLRGLFKKRPV